MEHLEGVINKPEAEMSPQELQLHYFKMHDYDGNNLLDGLELSTAITHVHKEEGSEQAPMNEDELINLIDGVLREDDKMVAKKVAASLRNKITPILCIG